MKAHLRLTERDRQYPFPELVQECYVPEGGYDQLKADFPTIKSMPTDLSKFFFTARLYGESFRAQREAAESQKGWRDRHADDMTPAQRERGALIEVV